MLRVQLQSMVYRIAVIRPRDDRATRRIFTNRVLRDSRIQLLVQPESRATCPDIGGTREPIAWQFPLNIEIPLVSQRIPQVRDDRGDGICLVKNTGSDGRDYL